MKRAITTFLFVFTFCLRAFSQTTEIDGWVSIDLPSQPVKTDTLGEEVYTSTTSDAIFSVSRIFRSTSEANVTPANLIDSYNNFISGNLAAMNTTVLDSCTVLVGKFKAKQFHFRTFLKGLQYDVTAIVLFIKQNMYEFMCFQNSLSYSSGHQSCRSVFFNSIKINSQLSANDQFTSAGTGRIDAYTMGKITGKILVLLIIGLGLLLLILFVIKRAGGHSRST